MLKLTIDWIFGDVACWLNNSVSFFFEFYLTDSSVFNDEIDRKEINIKVLYVNMFVSIFMLMFMALDRYLAVIRGSCLAKLSKYRNSQVVINTVSASIT